MRLIDANAISYDQLLNTGNKEHPLEWAVSQSRINSMPTVDAVEVVRCKDCKHRDPEDHKCDCGALERAGCVFPVGDNYFCSYGERREDV